MKKILLSSLALLSLTSVYAGTGIKSDPYSVDELIEMGIPSADEPNVYVKGYIVGSVKTTDTDFSMSEATCLFTATGNDVKTNILLAGTSAETELDYLLPIKVPAGDLRDVITVGGNPNVLGHEVILCGTLSKYFGRVGLTEISSYEWVGTAPDAPSAGDVATGTGSNPLTVTEFLAQGTPAVAVGNTYLTGYIVGYVPGMNISEAVLGTVGSDASASNILMAASSSETSYSNCVPVQLPTGDVRNALSLLNNPGNLGKQVTIIGSHEKYFGVNGMKSVTAYNFGATIEGGSDTPVQPGETGSADAPLSVSDFLALGVPSAAVKNTYVKGVIVGNIPGKSASEAIFTAEGASNSNILIAQSASETDYNKCIPVQLPAGTIRSELNLLDNPSNIGKTLTLCGSREKYFGISGLKTPTSYAWEGEVIAEGIYTGLVENAEGWTVENVELPSELTYVWGEWNTQYNYVSGSAYKDKISYAAEAYFISPVIDLTKFENVTVSFEHAAKFQTTLRELCGFAVREDGASEWTPCTIPTWPEAGSWNFVNSGEISLADFEGKKIQIAFKYASSDQGADTWELKKVIVNGDSFSSVVAVETEAAPVYVSGNSIVAPADAKVFNLNGVAVGRDNLASGVYIVVTSSKAVKLIVK